MQSVDFPIDCGTCSHLTDIAYVGTVLGSPFTGLAYVGAVLGSPLTGLAYVGAVLGSPLTGLAHVGAVGEEVEVLLAVGRGELAAPELIFGSRALL